MVELWSLATNRGTFSCQWIASRGAKNTELQKGSDGKWYSSHVVIAAAAAISFGLMGCRSSIMWVNFLCCCWWDQTRLLIDVKWMEIVLLIIELPHPPVQLGGWWLGFSRFFAYCLLNFLLDDGRFLCRLILVLVLRFRPGGSGTSPKIWLLLVRDCRPFAGTRES